MFSRLEQVLKAEGISRTQLADTLGVAPATISHLLSGRNKPSFEIIQAISQNFPDLSLDWLINGTGKMYKIGAQDTVNQDNIFIAPEDSPAVPTIENTSSISSTQKKQVATIQRNISKIVVFFDDGSYQEIPVRR